MTTLEQRVARAINESECEVATIADACGISVQAVYAWKRGEVKNLQGKNLFILADLTAFNARWIATGEGPERPYADEKEKALLDLYRACDERGRATVVRAAEFESSYTVDRVEKRDAAA